MLCMNGGGDRSRCSPGVSADCDPVALRFLLGFPGGLPSLLELPLPDCVAGGCQ